MPSHDEESDDEILQRYFPGSTRDIANANSGRGVIGRGSRGRGRGRGIGSGRGARPPRANNIRASPGGRANRRNNVDNSDAI